MFLTTKYEQIVKLEHLLCPKVGGGGTNPLVPPTFESGGGGLVPPFSYALGIYLPVTVTDFAISDKIHVSLGAYLDVRANRVTIKYERGYESERVFRPTDL